MLRKGNDVMTVTVKDKSQLIIRPRLQRRLIGARLAEAMADAKAGQFLRSELKRRKESNACKMIIALTERAAAPK
jgi:hypothetical protein